MMDPEQKYAYRLTVFKNNVQKRKGTTGAGRKLHIKKLRNMYASEDKTVGI
jgi:hypothetical protein